MSSCGLDTKTRWAGTYLGQECGITFESEQEFKVSETEATIVITQVAPGFYSHTVNGNFAGMGPAFITPDGVPVLRFNGTNGQPFEKFALRIDRKCRVRKFQNPVIFERGESKFSGIGIFRRISN